RILYQLALDKGNQYLGQSRGDLAIEAFKMAIQHQPQAAEAHMMLGYTYRVVASTEMIAEAKAELRQAVALDPNLAWARFYLARIYVDLGRLGKAKVELTEALRIDEKNPFFLAFLGDVNRQFGDPNLSIQLNVKAVEISPSLSLAHYYLGLAYNDLDQRDQALREFETAVECPQVLPEMHVALGSSYTAAERYSEAIRQFERALELDPNRAESHLNLAKAYRLSDRPDLAEKELRLLKESPQIQIQSPYFQEICAEASFESGLINRSQGKMSQARESFLEAVEVKQSYGLAHRQLAEVLFLLEEYSEALRHATKAEELGNPLEPSLFNKIREKVPAGSEESSSEKSRMDPR
ncbi:MAG TPA: tetratricopeptide repeat protein, partial [Acidobacteriota bacterium]|nr:tetratricopeptide repeat protein [Acidobacteriota bacterium]